jgi:hypothetical protein
MTLPSTAVPAVENHLDRSCALTHTGDQRNLSFGFDNEKVESTRDHKWHADAAMTPINVEL